MFAETEAQMHMNINKRSVLRRQNRETNRNIKRLVYCYTNHTNIRIGSTPTFLYVYEYIPIVSNYVG